MDEPIAMKGQGRMSVCLIKARVDERGKLVRRAESFSGYEVQRSTGKLVAKDRLIDKDADRYLERVVDLDTGVVIHHCDERLTEHQGHGSAKQRAP